MRCAHRCSRHRSCDPRRRARRQRGGQITVTCGVRAGLPALKVPAPLARRVVVSALPWVEIVLGVALVPLGGWVGLVVSLAVLALFAAYLALVDARPRLRDRRRLRLLRQLGPGRITTLTVWRNAWLVALAVGASSSLRRGDALLSRVIDGTAPWEWLLAAAAAALTCCSSSAPGTESRRRAEPPRRRASSRSRRATTSGCRTPAVAGHVGDGSTTHLRQLSAQRPQLLLYVSEACVSCEDVIACRPHVAGAAACHSTCGSCCHPSDASDPDVGVRSP